MLLLPQEIARFWKAIYKPYAIRTSAGVDLEAAGELGVKVIWALSLPGKVAPLTAAGAIKTAIYNILSELGV